MTPKVHKILDDSVYKLFQKEQNIEYTVINQKANIHPMKNDILTELIKSKWWVIKNGSWTLQPIQKTNTWNLFNNK